MISKDDNVNSDKNQEDKKIVGEGVDAYEEKSKEKLSKNTMVRIERAVEIARDKYWKYIWQSCEKYCIDIKLVLAIGARESDWGLGLKPVGEKGTGDWHFRPYSTKTRVAGMPGDGLGYGRGLMQIDYDWHAFARSGKWYRAEDNIGYAVWYLAMNRRVLSKFVGEMYIEDALIASYNLGLNRVLKLFHSNKLRYDNYTSNGDYVKWIKEAMIIGHRVEREMKFIGRRVRAKV